jgi:hypothetical protein
MCWKIWPEEFDKCRNDGCTEFYKNPTEFVNSILQLRHQKIKSLEAKLDKFMNVGNQVELEEVQFEMQNEKSID